MASNADDRNKPVTGYPSRAGRVATGFPWTPPQVDEACFYTPPPPPPHFIVPAGAAPSYRHRHRYCSSLLVRMITAMFSMLLIMGSVFLVSWLVLRPRLPEFRVASAAVSPLNSTSPGLTSTWDLSILVKNPNTKLNISYHRLEASVFYGDDVLLSQTELPPFNQFKGNVTLIHARLSFVGANVGKDVVKTILKDQKDGSVTFGVRVLTLIRFHSRGWRTRKHLIRVYCYGVKIGYSSSSERGSLLNPSKCQVEL